MDGVREELRLQTDRVVRHMLFPRLAGCARCKAVCGVDLYTGHVGEYRHGPAAQLVVKLRGFFYAVSAPYHEIVVIAPAASQQCVVRFYVLPNSFWLVEIIRRTGNRSQFSGWDQIFRNGGDIIRIDLQFL